MSFAEVRSNTALRPAGRCIYCLSIDALSDEHVIAFALGGNLYVPNASCLKCRNMTSGFELAVLRGFMYSARLVGNFPTRHPKEHPKTMTLTLLDRDAVREVVLPNEAAPALLQLPIFEPPRFLTGEPKIRGINLVGIDHLHFGAGVQSSIYSQRATGFRQSDTIPVIEFARMLAKTAYSYAVGVFGIVPLEQVFVLPLIRGETDDAGHWIGSTRFDTESEHAGALHALSHVIYETDVGDLRRVLAVRIKLFASSGATGYEVVVWKI